MAKWMPWVVVLVACVLGIYLLSTDPGSEPPAVGAGGAAPEGPDAGEDVRPTPEEAPGLMTQAGERPAPAPTPTVPIPQGGLRIIGTVHSPEGAPVEGAEVDLLIGYRTSASVTTTAAGRFALPVTAAFWDEQWWGTLRARSGDQVVIHPLQLRAAPAADPIGPEIDAGTLTLEMGASLTLEAVLPSGASGPVTFWILRADMRSHVLHARLEADAAGRAVTPAVPPGTWRVLATADGAGRGETFVKVPQTEPEVVRVELTEERVGTVTVVDKESQEPIAGARLACVEFVQMPGVNTSLPLVPPLEDAVTDAQGRYVFRGLNAMSSLTLYVTAEGYPARTRGGYYGREAAGEARLRRGIDGIRVELQKPRTVRWPVVASGEHPVPADGTAIALKPQVRGPGEIPAALPSGVMQGGQLVVENVGPGYLHAYAVAPDGALARLFCKDGATEGMETSFVPARTLRVTLTYPDGSPAAGLYVSAANQGNNPLIEPVRTGEDGVAVAEGFYGGEHSLAEVRVAEIAVAWGGMHIGSVDFQKGDAELEATVRRALPVTVRVRIGGEARLPEPTERSPTGALSIRVGGMLASQDLEVDAEHAEVRFSWRPPPGMTEAWLNVALPGYLPHAAKFDVPASRETVVLDAALEAAGSIHVTGKPPADKRRQRVQVQRWDPEKGTWVTTQLPMMAMGGYARFDAEGHCVLTPLPEGRYRVIDVANFVATEAVDVVVGGEAPHVVLDASKAGFVKGTVQVPEGVDAQGLLVVTEGGPDFNNPFMGRLPGSPSPPKGLYARVNDKGEFWLRVPGTMSMKIRAEGMGLVPAQEGGTLTVKAPKEGVALKVVRGKVARLRFDKPLETWINRGQPRTIQVAFYRGKADGEPARLSAGMLDAEGRQLEFGLPEPGTWTVWIDAGPYCPVVLEDVVFGTEDVDLGTASVQEGSIVRIEVLLKEGASMPRMYAQAVYQGTPAYTRRRDSGSATRFAITGLGPGRFRLYVGSHMGTAGGLNEEIEVDGVTAVSRVVDLRK